MGARHPGNTELEYRIRSIIRWNAMATVLRASKRGGELGGHIASFASAATLYDVGFNHFFRGPEHPGGGDLVYIQGHSSPGIYARSYLEGRISEEQLDKFRQETDGTGPEFLSTPLADARLLAAADRFHGPGSHHGHLPGAFPEVPARSRHCGHRPIARSGVSWATAKPTSRNRWAPFRWPAGRGSTTSIFVINCNLQRLDGPVRGNGKIIQELEGVFRGAGWNVIKVIWGSYWDKLFAKDKNGLLRKRMEEAVDGEYQNYKAKGGEYTREHFFGKYPELLEMVATMTDEDIWRLNRGGHDPHKLYAAYSAGHELQEAADRHPGQDRQGLRHGRRRRGAEHHPPAEENGRGVDPPVPRSLRRADPG